MSLKTIEDHFKQAFRMIREQAAAISKVIEVVDDDRENSRARTDSLFGMIQTMNARIELLENRLDQLTNQEKLH
jgi:uncharacterized protein Yka (UPF0111/DUF47 family)